MEPAAIEPADVLRNRAIPLSSINEGIAASCSWEQPAPVRPPSCVNHSAQTRFVTVSIDLDSKTTVADTQIIVVDGPFQAVVTFFRATKSSTTSQTAH